MGPLNLRIISSFFYSFVLHLMAIITLLSFSPAVYRAGYYFPHLEARLYYEDIPKKISPSNKKDIFIKKGSTHKPESIFNEKDNKKTEKTDTEHVNLENKEGTKKEFDNTMSNIEKDEPNNDSNKTLLSQREINNNEISIKEDHLNEKTVLPELEAQNEQQIGRSPFEQRLIQKEDIEHKQIEKIEEGIKTTRVTEDASLFEEKAVDSLFDKEGIGNKDSLSEQNKRTVLKHLEHPKKIHIKSKENIITHRQGKRQIKNNLEKKTSVNIPNKSTTTDMNKKESESQNTEESKQLELKSLIETNTPKIVMEYPIGQDHTVVVQEIQPIPKNNENHAMSTKKDPSSEINNINLPVTDKDITSSILLPEPYGDLKFEIKIEGGLNNELKTYIIFKEYTKKNKRTPPKKSEINPLKIEPLIIEKTENIKTLIINQVKEGIYDLIIEPLKPLSLSIVFKVYEKRPDEKIKNIGIIRVNKKMTIAKILLPEGIFWDDDSYFDGYMEDSESITKFNTQEGLIWREYKEEEL
jgi:hypothetical protein